MTDNDSKASDNKSIFSNISLTLVRQIIATLLQVLLIIYLTNYYGAKIVGYYSLGLVIPTLFTQIFSLGIFYSNIYYISSGRYDLSYIWPITRDSVFLMAVIGISFGLLLIAFLYDILFSGIPSFVIYTMLCIFPLAMTNESISSLFVAIEDFQSYNIVILLQPLLLLIVITLSLICDVTNFQYFLMLILASYIISTCFALYKISQKVDLLARARGHLDYLRIAVKYGLKIQVSNAIVLLNYRIDIIILNYFVGPAVVGVYTIAARLVEQLWVISSVVTAVILPRMSALKDNEKLRLHLTALLSKIVLYITLLGSLALMIVAKPVIAIVFGEEFVEASIIINYLLPGVVFFASGRVITNSMIARDMAEINLYIASAMFVVNFTGNLILIPKYGVFGAAAATSISYLFVYLAALYFEKKFFKSKITSYIFINSDDIINLRRLLGNFKLKK